MKVLFVYLFCTKGGVETALKNRIAGIDLSENTIDLLFFQDFGGSSMFCGEASNVFIMKDDEKICKLIQQNNYDYVISIDTPKVLDLLKKIQYKGKVALEVHTTYPDSLKYLSKIQKNDIDFIIVPSAYQKRIIKDLLKVEIQIYILPNPIDTERFNEMSFNVYTQKPILLWVGRLDKHKNWRLFLDIAKEIKKLSNTNFEYWIVGGGHSEKNEMNNYRETIYNNDLNDTLRWIPAINNSKMCKVYNYVKKSKGAYILTSNNESFGMTILEAMACMCPVICNNVGAVGEIVEDGKTGLLLNMQDYSINGIAACILEFMQDSKLLNVCKDNAYKKAKLEYSKEIVSKKFLDIIEQ